MEQQDVEYAGFWIRFWASLIDTILLMVVIVPLLVAVYGWVYFTEESSSVYRGPADFLISVVFPLAVIVAFWFYKQATPGKMMLNMKIVDAKTGGPISVGQSIGRYFAYILSTIPFCLGFLWVAFDRRKQGWHDKLAGTVVIRSTKTEPVKFDKAG
jgi:uncharacterized RDD family membrane protein YckC